MAGSNSLDLLALEMLQKLINELKDINLKLWNIEEEKRICEKNADFGKNFTSGRR